MASHPRAPYPKAPSPEGVTYKRLWFLARALGFDDSQIAELTGITRPEVVQALKDHGVSRRDLLHREGRDIALLLFLAKQLGVSLGRIGYGEAGRRFARRSLREAVADGRVPWSAIDALPEVEEIVSIH